MLKNIKEDVWIYVKHLTQDAERDKRKIVFTRKETHTQRLIAGPMRAGTYIYIFWNKRAGVSFRFFFSVYALRTSLYWCEMISTTTALRCFFFLRVEHLSGSLGPVVPTPHCFPALSAAAASFLEERHTDATQVYLLLRTTTKNTT